MNEKEKYKFHSIPQGLDGLEEEVKKLIEEDTGNLLNQSLTSGVTSGYSYTDSAGHTHIVDTMATPSTVSASFDINWMTSSYWTAPVNLTIHLDKINNKILQSTLKIAQTLLYCNHELMSRANVSKIDLYR